MAANPTVAKRLRAQAIDLMPPAFRSAMLAAETISLQPVMDCIPSTLARGPMALVGDAGVVLRPHASMGLAKAAGDVLALDHHLSTLPVAEALVAYWAERLPAGRSLAAFGRRLGAGLG